MQYSIELSRAVRHLYGYSICEPVIYQTQHEYAGAIRLIKEERGEVKGPGNGRTPSRLDELTGSDHSSRVGTARAGVRLMTAWDGHQHAN